MSGFSHRVRQRGQSAARARRATREGARRPRRARGRARPHHPAAGFGDRPTRDSSGGAGLLARTFHDLLETSGGFRADGAVAGLITLPASEYPDVNSQRQLYQRLLDNLRTLQTTTAVGFGSTLPLNGRRSERVFTPDQYIPPPNATLNLAGQATVGGAYLQAIGATLLRGRYFTPHDDERNATVAIVTEGLARHYWRTRMSSASGSNGADCNPPIRG